MSGWIMSIAGLVVLSAVCDIVMPDGEMKKYIKPIMGFVLIITIIKPLTGGIFDNINIELPQDYSEISARATNVELVGVREIYEKKLAKKAEEYIRNNFDIDASVEVCTADNEENFGEITEIKIDADVAHDVIKKLAKEFGVDPRLIGRGGEEN